MTKSTRQQVIDNMTLACVIEHVYAAGKATTTEVAEACTAGDEKDATRLLRKADARAFIVGHTDNDTMTWVPISSDTKRGEADGFVIKARGAAIEQGLIAAQVPEGVDTQVAEVHGNVVTLEVTGEGASQDDDAKDAVEAAEGIVKAAKAPKSPSRQPKPDLVVGFIDAAFAATFKGAKPAIDMIAHYTKSATRLYTCEAANVNADDGMKFVVVCMSHAVKGTQVPSKPEGLKGCRKPEKFCAKCAALIA